MESAIIGSLLLPMHPDRTSLHKASSAGPPSKSHVNATGLKVLMLYLRYPPTAKRIFPMRLIFDVDHNDSYAMNPSESLDIAGLHNIHLPQLLSTSSEFLVAATV
ncbi:unnamed protein product [Protopolystoma xenopodis]|uniref:Uncharacterized protein n=1 Tax=Protopolystoma xenopodis TaxID=117903 RepID=A0A3S4ZYE9_9PLAT|nr:unnamed protein product [Protopolystoma xenopodis]